MTDRGDRQLVGLVLAVALAAGLTAGCADRSSGGGTSVPGTSQGPDPGDTAPASVPPTTQPTPPAVTPPAVAPPSLGSTDGPTLTVTGTVEAGVEAGCLVLTADGETYLLLGARNLVRAGDRVTVDGVLARDVVTTCQQGTPLRVQAVRPG